MPFTAAGSKLRFLVLFVLVLTACQPYVVPSPAPGSVEAGRTQGSNRGFVVLTGSIFQGYAPDGALLDFRMDAGISPTPRLNQVQVLKNTILFSSPNNQGVEVLSRRGLAPLDYVPTGRPVYFAVSPDLTQIAWSVEEYSVRGARSELWLAGMRGENARRVLSTEPGDAAVWVARPFRWLNDGSLIFSYEMMGIGGYLPFTGLSSLYVYEPTGDRTTVLLPHAIQTALCVDDLLDDLSRVALSCGGQIKLHSLVDGSEVTLPRLPGQVMAGSTRFSPSGRQVAYGIARGQERNEHSEVVLAAADGSAQPQSILSLEGGTQAVVAWLGEDTLLLQRSQPGVAASVWMVRSDGSGLKKVADGTFAGWISSD